MPKAAELVYVRGSLRKGACFSLVVVTAPSARALAISAWDIIIASDPVQTAPVAGSSNLTALGLWWTWRSGRVVADGSCTRTFRTCVVARTWLKRTSGKCGEHGVRVRPYSHDI